MAPIVEEITVRGAVLPGLLARYGFLVANTLTALLSLGLHLPGWYPQGHLPDVLTHLVGGPLSTFGVGWALGLVACEHKSVAGSTLAHVLNNLLNAP